MAESPTIEQVKAERTDIQTYVDDNEASLTLDDYIAKALAQVKRDLRDVKGIKWNMVYDSVTADYFLNTDDEAINKDRLHNAIILLTVAYVFKDYSINRQDDGMWNSMFVQYRADYDRAIAEMVIDVDWDESGEVSEGEEYNTTQTFIGR